MPNVNSLMFRSRLQLGAFTHLVELFAAEVPSYRIAAETGISRVTVSKILTALRRRLATHARRIEPGGRRIRLPDEWLRQARPEPLRGRPPTGISQVAAVVCGEGTVSADLILDFPRALWRYLDLELGVLESMRSLGVFQDAVALLDLQSFEIISLAPPREGEGPRFRGAELATVEEFGAFTGTRFRRVRGIPEERLWLYLTEVEFRFNRRGEDLTAGLLEMLRIEPLRLSN